jgi:demethylspheroidene O-methyltransferase
MRDLAPPVPPAADPPVAKARGWRGLIASPRFQAWVARTPILRRFARRDGEALFDLVQGFVQSQILAALVEFDLPARLIDGPASSADLARQLALPEPRLTILLQGAAAMGLLRRRRDGRFDLARKGAALLGVPGLREMIRHHRTLYRDLDDPVAFFRGETDPDLARFWPYVFGATGAADPDTVARYSALMADSQALVAADTLDAVSLKGARRLLDVGGGSGVFVAAAARAHPDLALDLFDLPAVRPSAESRLDHAGLSGRVTIHAGSFRDDPLPAGADVITLIRVLYDHADTTVAALLAKVFDALPPNGRLIVSEPMSGGPRPDPVTDVYFATYTLAMGTGRTRSAAEIAALLHQAGFDDIQPKRSSRPYVTSVITARRRG